MADHANAYCPKPFNHLPFFIGPVIAGIIILAVCSIAARAPEIEIRVFAWIFSAVLALAEILVHIFCIRMYRKGVGKTFAYSPTDASYYAVAGIHIVMLLLIAVVAAGISDKFDISKSTPQAPAAFISR